MTIDVTCTNQPPVAVDDQTTSDEDAAVTVDVLSNASDDSGLDSTTVEIVSAPAYGMADVVAGGAIRYTPDVNWLGADTFTHGVRDTAGFGIGRAA